MKALGVGILVLHILLIGCQKKENLSEAEENNRIRDFVSSQSLNAFSQPSIDHVKSTVDLVHKRVPLRVSSPTFWNLSKLSNIFNSFTNPNYGHVCGGLAITTMDILRAFGYQVWIVQAFSDGPDGHVLIEVMVGEDKILLDPTFNEIFINDTGNPIGVEELTKRIQDGESIKWKYINGSHFKIEDYYISLNKLFYNLRILPEGVRDMPPLTKSYPNEVRYLELTK